MKTNELTGSALDWAVATCLEIKVTFDSWGVYYIGKVVRDDDGLGCPMPFEPSTDWAQGGPIIESEEMTLSHSPYDHVFYGRSRPWCAEKKGRIEYGPTPLIAAMRCYVASKLGNDIDIPEELA
jgi:hypothetical protein